VAATLTGHLVRQIQVRGARGGPLNPLADQLNHDLTHLQGQRVESMVAQVLEMLGAGDGAALPGGVPKVAGWPLADVRDPFALEVHRPVEPDAPLPGLPVLPEYWPRDHDVALAEMVTAAAAGTSGIAVLVGGSSTGKTRACWEALALLRDVEPGWRLWHPIDPSPRQAVLAGLAADRRVAERGPELPQVPRRGAGGGRAAGSGTQSGPWAGAGAGHPVARILE